MAVSLAGAADEIRATIASSLIRVWIDDPVSADHIFVGNEQLCYCVSRLEVKGNLHLERTPANVAALKGCLAQYHANLAAEYDLKIANSVIDAYKRGIP